MNTQTITLTPPIDGVQWGYNSDEIKEGDFYYLESVTTKNMILKASESKISSNCKKILFSNNPKDTRFPYLQLPSKEQEVDELVKSYTQLHFGKRQVDEYIYDAFIAGFNANPVNTQAIELLKHYVGEIDELNSQQKEFGDKVEQFLLSLQPTAKAVRVEMEEVVNMDYKPSFGGGSDGHYNPMYVEQIKVETSSEFEQGVVKALEVIY